jgi:hypothetical protein
VNIEEIVKSINKTSEELYPGELEVAKLCEVLLRWERENITKTTTRYKEPYRKILDGIVKRMLES